MFLAIYFLSNYTLPLRMNLCEELIRFVARKGGHFDEAIGLVFVSPQFQHCLRKCGGGGVVLFSPFHFIFLVYHSSFKRLKKTVAVFIFKKNIQKLKDCYAIEKPNCRFKARSRRPR